jgi:hypothetical protein
MSVNSKYFASSVPAKQEQVLSKPEVASLSGFR